MSLAFSLFSKSSTPNSPDAKPGQSKEDTTEDSQTGPSGPAKPETEPASTADKSEPVVASTGEPEKKGEDAPAAEPAPPTDSKEPFSTPPASDALPGAPPPSESTDPRPMAISKETAATGATLKGDSTPKSDQGPDPEKVREPEATTTAGGPVDPNTSETERRREFERKRTLIIHTRFAKFFTWILLLAFVILPGTFSRVQNNQANNQDSSTNPQKESTATKVIDEIANLPLLAIGYVCCVANACVISWLWYRQSDDPDWLFTNLFFAGFINAFSGLLTTFVNIYGAQGGQYGAASSATLAVASTCTAIYAVLTVVYYRKRSRYRYQRPRPNSSIA